MSHPGIGLPVSNRVTQFPSNWKGVQETGLVSFGVHKDYYFRT